MRPTPFRVAAVWAGLLSLFASFVHGSLIQEHFREWWGYGLFFVLASIAQGVYGLVLLALPERPSAWTGRHWEAWKRRLLLAGILGNGAVMAMYLATRTIGIPLFGPGAGQVEPWGTADLLTLGAEAGTLAWLIWLLAARTEDTATPQAA